MDGGGVGANRVLPSLLLARHPLTFALSAGVTTGAQVITTPSRTRIAFSIIVSHTDRRRKTILIAQDILTTSPTAQALSSPIPAVPNIPAKTEALSACGCAMDGMDGRDDGKTRLARVAPRDDPIDSEAASQIFESDGAQYAGSESSKIGVTGAVFLILNKMIGTGSRHTPGSAFASHVPNVGCLTRPG